MRLLKITPVNKADDTERSNRRDDDGDDIEFELVTVHQPVRYAILSHIWDCNPDNEFLFEDIRNGSGRSKAGYQKVKQFLAAVRKHNSEIWYGWVDTCCIDKNSSSELSEAINSMFRFYQEAEFCFVHLADFEDRFCELGGDELGVQLGECRWFYRGWTLQELLAPMKIEFYSQNWRHVGDRQGLRPLIAQFTGIHAGALEGDVENLRCFSIAQRMSWAAHRETTRPEDIAYCLLGIFDVNMPLLYGERNNAFTRLQEEIIKDSDDQTIFCWTRNGGRELGRYTFENASSFLALSPFDFRNSGNIAPSWGHVAHPYVLTNAGLRITVPIEKHRNHYRILLNCGLAEERWTDQGKGITLAVVRLGPDSNQFLRVPSDMWCSNEFSRVSEEEIYLCKKKPSNLRRLMGYGASIRVAINPENRPNTAASLNILQVFPSCRWDSNRNLLFPIDLVPEHGALTRPSWHVAVAISMKWLIIETVVFAFVGYDSSINAAWCYLQDMPEREGLSLFKFWCSLDDNLPRRRSTTLAMTARPEVALNCAMILFKPDGVGVEEDGWVMKLRLGSSNVFRRLED